MVGVVCGVPTVLYGWGEGTFIYKVQMFILSLVLRIMNIQPLIAAFEDNHGDKIR